MNYNSPKLFTMMFGIECARISTAVANKTSHPNLFMVHGQLVDTLLGPKNNKHAWPLVVSTNLSLVLPLDLVLGTSPLFWFVGRNNFKSKCKPQRKETNKVPQTGWQLRTHA
jgi:hypothetical protein